MLGVPAVNKIGKMKLNPKSKSLSWEIIVLDQFMCFGLAHLKYTVGATNGTGKKKCSVLNMTRIVFPCKSLQKDLDPWQRMKLSEKKKKTKKKLLKCTDGFI